MKLPPLLSRWFLPKSKPVVAVEVILDGDLVEALGPGHTLITTRNFDLARDRSTWLPMFTDSKEMH